MSEIGCRVRLSGEQRYCKAWLVRQHGCLFFNRLLVPFEKSQAIAQEFHLAGLYVVCLGFLEHASRVGKALHTHVALHQAGIRERLTGIELLRRAELFYGPLMLSEYSVFKSKCAVR